jgi:hypothetical protein
MTSLTELEKLLDGIVGKKVFTRLNVDKTLELLKDFEQEINRREKIPNFASRLAEDKERLKKFKREVERFKRLSTAQPETSHIESDSSQEQEKIDEIVVEEEEVKINQPTMSEQRIANLEATINQQQALLQQLQLMIQQQQQPNRNVFDNKTAISIVPIYNGDPENLDVFSEAIKYLDSITDTTNKTSMIRFIKTRMVKKAKTVAASKETIAEIITALEENCKSKETTVSLEAKIMSLKQGNKTATKYTEELESLTTKLLDLYIKSGTSVTQSETIVNSLAIKSLMSGCKNAGVKMLLKTSKPKTQFEATTLVIQEEADESPTQMASILKMTIGSNNQGKNGNYRGNRGKNGYNNKNWNNRNGNNNNDNNYGGQNNWNNNNNGNGRNNYNNYRGGRNNRGRGNHNNNNNRNINYIAPENPTTQSVQLGHQQTNHHQEDQY